jgi:hypothetical protein
MRSTVLIIPNNLVDFANQVAYAMGWGNNNYSVPLSSDGHSVTHYGLHAYTSEQFENWIKKIEPLPLGMEYAQPIIDNLIYSFRDDITDLDHFNEVLSENNLSMISEVDSLNEIE